MRHAGMMFFLILSWLIDIDFLILSSVYLKNSTELT